MEHQVNPKGRNGSERRPQPGWAGPLQSLQEKRKEEGEEEE